MVEGTVHTATGLVLHLLELQVGQLFHIFMVVTQLIIVNHIII